MSNPSACAAIPTTANISTVNIKHFTSIIIIESPITILRNDKMTAEVLASTAITAKSNKNKLYNNKTLIPYYIMAHPDGG